MTLLCFHGGKLAIEQVQELLGYDKGNAQQKYAFWARSRTT